MRLLIGSHILSMMGFELECGVDNFFIVCSDGGSGLQRSPWFDKFFWNW